MLLWNLGSCIVHVHLYICTCTTCAFVVRCWFQFAVGSAALCAVFVWGLRQHRIVFIAARLGLLYPENKLPPPSPVSSLSLSLSLSFPLSFPLPLSPPLSLSLPLPPSPACRILAHSQCIKQLYYEGYTCKDTFREIKQKVREVRKSRNLVPLWWCHSDVTLCNICIYYVDTCTSPLSASTEAKWQV